MSEPGTSPADSLAEAIRSKFRRHLAAKKSVRGETANRASELGHPCLRYLVLLRRDGENRRLPSDELQAIFEEGKRVELQMRSLLAELGYDLEAVQASFPSNTYQITGHIDGTIFWNGRLILVEIKGLNGSDFERVLREGVDYIKRNPKAWLAKWYVQLQLYLFLADIEEGLWILKNKWSGMIELFTLKRDLDYIEPLLDKAERINRHMQARTLPGFINDPPLCQSCPFFGRACTPPLEWDESVAVVDDPEVIARFDRRAELAAMVGSDVAELRGLERWCKDYIRRRAGKAERVLVGNTVARVSRGERSGHFVAPSSPVFVELESLHGEQTDADSEEPHRPG